MKTITILEKVKRITEFHENSLSLFKEGILVKSIYQSEVSFEIIEKGENPFVSINS